MTKYVLMQDNYGPLKARTSYRIITEGRDWYRVRHRGGLFFIGKHLAYENPEEILLEETDDEVELDEDLIFLD